MLARYPPWQINETARGMYFYNEVTLQSTWQPPLELEHTCEVQRWYAQRGYRLPKGGRSPTSTMSTMSGSVSPAPSLPASAGGSVSVPVTMPDVPSHSPVRPGSARPRIHLASVYASYKEHHQHWADVVLHALCVPAMFLASIVMLQGRELLPTNVGSWVCAAYGVYYLILDVRLGFVVAPLLAAAGFGAHWFRWHFPQFVWLAPLIFMSAWVLQLLGHFAFEQKRPALCTSVFEGVVIAPVVLIIDLLRCFGVQMVPGSPIRGPGLAHQASSGNGLLRV